MTYVIALPCVDVKDRACIDECPVDCIYEGERSLYIHPDECVDCGACEPVCPVEAIYYEDDLPEEWQDYYKANVEFFDDIGSPGGAAKVGVIHKDHPVIAALPPQETAMPDPASGGGLVDSTEVDVVIIGGGPAGLSAALNLGRARASVVVVDAGRPRNAATLRSHGFLTRDGVSPLELRKLARAELAAYPNVRVLDRTVVDGAARERMPATGMRFIAALQGRSAGHPACRRRPLGARRDRAARDPARDPEPARLLRHDGLQLRGVRRVGAAGSPPRPHRRDPRPRRPRPADRALDRPPHRLHQRRRTSSTRSKRPSSRHPGSSSNAGRIDDLEGDRGAVSAVRLIDGTRVEIDGGFVRPQWHPALDFLGGHRRRPRRRRPPRHRRSGRTSVAGLYAAGDAAAPGPQQLIVAAGQGARAAAVLVHDLVGVRTAH